MSRGRVPIIIFLIIKPNMDSSQEDLPSPPLSQEQDMKFLSQLNCNFNIENGDLMKISSTEECELMDPFHLMPDQTNEYSLPFKLLFLGNEQLTKSIPWTFSKDENKLFAAFNRVCPIVFSFFVPPRLGSVIRATPMFKAIDQAKNPVVRCHAHRDYQHPSNLGINALRAPIDHVLRCDSPNAIYETIEGHPSVVVPYNSRESNGCQNIFNYQFMCLTSCVGGMNRRPIVVTFSLEFEGIILGTQEINVRVCACPGRDRKHSEKQMMKRKAKDDQFHSSQEAGCSTSLPLEQAIKRKAKDIASYTVPEKKVKKEEERVYSIEVKNYEVYKLLKQLAERMK